MDSTLPFSADVPPELLADVRPGSAWAWISAHRDALLATLLAAATVLLYLRSAWCGFINYDDPAYIWSNPDLALGLTPAGLRYAFTAHAPYWHPFVWLVDLAIYAQWGARAGPYHVVNFCFLAASAALLYLFWVRATGDRGLALVATALWAWHPLRVESVVWVAETKDVSAGFFWILAMVLYVRYARRPGLWRYLAVSAAFGMALCCKPSVVTFPFAMLLLDVWPLRRLTFGTRDRLDLPDSRPSPPWRTILLEKVPWILLAAAGAAAAYLAQRGDHAVTSGGNLPLHVRLEHAATSYLWYAGKNVWPRGLAIFYPHPYFLWGSIGLWRWTSACVALVVMTTIAVIGRKRQPAPLVGWLWFLGTFAPMIGLVQVGLQGMADRHTLVPSIGLVAAVVWSVGAFVRQQSRGIQRASTAAVVLILIAECVVTLRQIGFWQDTRTVMSHAYDVVPDNYFAAGMLGEEYTQPPRDLRRALVYAQAAVRIAPMQPVPHQALAAVLLAQGDERGSLRELERAARLNPTNVENSKSVGAAEIRLGRYDRALLWYSAAVRTDPNDVIAEHNVALCLAHEGHLNEAIARWRTLLQAHPTFDLGHARLAEALQEQGDLAGAAQHYRAAVRLGNTDPLVEENYAWLMATDASSAPADVDAALPVARDAVQQQPTDPVALDALAATLARCGQFDEAVRTARAGVRVAIDRGQSQLARAIAQREVRYADGQPFLVTP